MGYTNSDTMPCRNCTDRHYLCHAECDKYKKVVESLHKATENRRKEKLMNVSASAGWGFDDRGRKKK